jgi:hypothetical protein
MEENELVIDRENQINELCNNLLNIADGKDIIGDGKKLVRDAEFAKITHDFTDGIYIRKMDMKAGSVVIGAFWKYEHFWFLMKGNITVADKYGVKEYIAPCYVRSLPGEQRVIHANEDCIFMNVHKNPENITDIDELELYTCSLNMEEYNKYIKDKK